MSATSTGGVPRHRAAASTGIEVLVVAVDSTGGWTAAAHDLATSIARAGASVRVAGTGPVPRVRTFALTDLSQAWMARQAAQRAIAAHAPRAVVYCSVTASLLWPRRRDLARRRRGGEPARPARDLAAAGRAAPVAEAPLHLLLWSERALEGLQGPHAPALVVSPPIDLTGPPLNLHGDLAGA